MKLLLKITFLYLLFSSHLQAQEQSVSLVSDLEGIYPGEVVTVSLLYNISDVTQTSGLGLRVFYDSSQLEIQQNSTYFLDGKIAHAIQEDIRDLDDDPSTNVFINISWASISGQWPSFLVTDLSLAELVFVTTKTFNGSTLRVKQSSNAVGYRFVGDKLFLSATI
jgi:hypothetical protein